MKEIIYSGLRSLYYSEEKSEKYSDQLTKYGEALILKNKTMNLTSITKPSEVANLHMLDCAVLTTCTKFEGKSVIDVGSGAGFPGIVLKILIPDLKLTLLDSAQKKLDWINELRADLNLSDIVTLHGRAEDLGKCPQFREQYDIATARAVADLRVLSELCLPFIKVGGLFLAMKSQKSNQEITASKKTITALGGIISQVYDYYIPETNVAHRIIIIRKISATPEKFPRRWAKIQHNTF